METKIINLFAGPSAGKSSIASGVCHLLKKNHITCDNPYEFAKSLSFDGNFSAIKDQLYVVANQHRNIVRCYGNVEFVVTDSPILLSLVYKDSYDKETNSYPSRLYGNKFDDLILDIHKSYECLNIFLKRSDDTLHNDKERLHNTSESTILDDKIEDMLRTNGIVYETINVDNTTSELIYEKICSIRN